ncbi:Histone acetyltransferase MYST4 [Wickerhamomyces ciferrii]|uniref:histone acetyltransferase n=1 Tax=Wickerhamomyces ciferrii (strain ATCC 14091 / BCRC 22168 / CBS 111 / JCM 3599 / NBRC 0793 / NRRL Y-1031 F-60-10) TaxID=1206466 RepID=K0KLC5_WICCF|nr:Histone acetyltransferase MYST4 [Wickerhamomyces ciferrii]CCH46060.1 Histone acetyltransferase MYST4 [Wickerhamomyces ciferrii]
MSHKLDVEDGLYGIIESPNISRIRFGEYELNTWYGSAVYFAKDKSTLGYKYNPTGGAGGGAGRKKSDVNKDDIWLEKLFICDSCFKYTDVKQEFDDHVQSCEYENKQLGKIMYKDEKYCIRKVRGSHHKLFTQNLCLFTKLFLDNKSVFFTVDYFEFYIVYGSQNNKPMGFFSKELLSWDKNNLACILVFPPYQRMHLGTLLISFSYELSKSQNLISGPEKPLSPFGLIGYLKYWTSILTREFVHGKLSNNETVTLDEVSKITGIRQDDVVMTLKHMKVLVMKDQIIYIKKKILEDWAKKNKVSFEPLLKKGGLLLE